MDVELLGDQRHVRREGVGERALRDHHVGAGEGLAHLELVRGAHLEAERDQLAHGAHLAGEGRVDGRLVGLRVRREVHALGLRGGPGGTHEILIDLLGEEGREGGDEAA